jgi:hypothetical protein
VERLKEQEEPAFPLGRAIPLTDEQRRELIAVTAYYLAERRNFQPGHEDEDWLAAEVQIGSMGALVS